MYITRNILSRKQAAKVFLYEQKRTGGGGVCDNQNMVYVVYKRTLCNSIHGLYKCLFYAMLAVKISVIRKLIFVECG